MALIQKAIKGDTKAFEIIRDTKNIINFVTPDIALKTFNFMKEKRLEIEKRKTVEELEALEAVEKYK